MSPLFPHARGEHLGLRIPQSQTLRLPSRARGSESNRNLTLYEIEPHSTPHPVTQKPRNNAEVQKSDETMRAV